MSDLIKRSDAIKAVEESLKLLARPRYTVKTAIEAIPSVDVDISEYSDKLWRNAYERGKADRPLGWIPCSERLPEGSDGISECEMVLMTLSVGYVACGWINGDTAYVLINNPVHDQIVIADRKDVLAWMPLPEPWKREDDE